MNRVLIFGQKPKDYISPPSEESLDVIISKNIREAKMRVSSERLIMIIIDLEDNEKNGMILAEHIRKSPLQLATPIIFISKNRRKWQKAINEYHCYDYFLKPLSSQDVMKILCLCYFRIERDDNKNVIVFQIGTEKYPIRTDDVIYIDKLARKTIVHTSTRELYIPSLSLNDFLVEHSNDFIQIHRGTIVNKSQIRCIIPGKQVVLLKHNDEELIIGRSFIDEVRNSFD